MNYEVADDGNLSSGGGGEQFLEGSESVSSTEDVPAEQPEPNVQVTHEVIPGNTTDTRGVGMKKAGKKISFKLICGLIFSILAIFLSLLWIDTQDEGVYLVPT